MASLCLDGKKAAHEGRVQNDSDDYDSLSELTLATQLLYCFYDIRNNFHLYGDIYIQI